MEIEYRSRSFAISRSNSAIRVSTSVSRALVCRARIVMFRVWPRFHNLLRSLISPARAICKSLSMTVYLECGLGTRLKANLMCANFRASTASIMAVVPYASANRVLPIGHLDQRELLNELRLKSLVKRARRFNYDRTPRFYGALQ